MFLSGYLTHRLTGRFVDSVGCQVGYVPFDYKRLRWAGAATGSGRRCPSTRDLLPELVPPARCWGRSRRRRPRPTGIPLGLPVIAAAADKACEVLGAGCLEPHIGCLSYGTTATINTTHRRYVEADPLSAALPGRRARRLQPGGPDLPRLLDGELVQDGSSATGKRQLAAERGSSPRRCSTSWSTRCRPAPWD